MSEVKIPTQILKKFLVVFLPLILSSYFAAYMHSMSPLHMGFAIALIIYASTYIQTKPLMFGLQMLGLTLLWSSAFELGFVHSGPNQLSQEHRVLGVFLFFFNAALFSYGLWKSSNLQKASS